MAKWGCGLLLILIGGLFFCFLWWGDSRRGLGLSDTEQTAVYAMQKLMRETASESKKREMQKAIDDMYEKARQRDEDRIAENKRRKSDITLAKKAINENNMVAVVDLCKHDYIREEVKNCEEYEDKLLAYGVDNNDDSLIASLCKNYRISKRNGQCTDLLKLQVSEMFSNKNYSEAFGLCKDNITTLYGECCSASRDEFVRLSIERNGNDYERLCREVLTECDSLWREKCINKIDSGNTKNAAEKNSITEANGKTVVDSSCYECITVKKIKTYQKEEVSGGYGKSWKTMKNYIDVNLVNKCKYGVKEVAVDVRCSGGGQLAHFYDIGSNSTTNSTFDFPADLDVSKADLAVTKVVCE